MEWIENTCECGAEGAASIFLAQDLNFGATEEEGRILKCESCGSFFPAHVPSEETIGSAYKAYYTSSIGNPSWVRARLRWLINLTRRDYNDRGASNSTNSVLDYGCGGGEYLTHLKVKGYGGKLFGTDVIEVENSQSKGFCFKDFDVVGRDGETFDHVTLGHVIEHVHDARKTVQKLYELTKVDGKVWMATPNSNSILVSCFGEYARDIDFPRHIHVFSKECLLGILEDGGFDVEFVSPPRVNTMLNSLSCLRNVWRHAETGKSKKVRISIVSGLKLFVHLVSPREMRDASAGEIVVLCRKA